MNSPEPVSSAAQEASDPPRTRARLAQVGLAVAITASLGAAAAGAYLAVDFKHQLSEARQDLSTRGDELKALQARLDDQGKELAAANEQLKKLADDRAELERTRASVEAFARQAASCQAVKRKLHIQS